MLGGDQKFSAKLKAGSLYNARTLTLELPKIDLPKKITRQNSNQNIVLQEHSSDNNVSYQRSKKSSYHDYGQS